MYKFNASGLDAHGILSCAENENFPFAEIAKRFVLIEDATRPVLIPKEEAAAEIADALRRGYVSRSLLRQAGKYCVNVRYETNKEIKGKRKPAPFELLCNAKAIEPLGEKGILYVLTDLSKYDDFIGLKDNIEEGGAIIY